MRVQEFRQIAIIRQRGEGIVSRDFGNVRRRVERIDTHWHIVGSCGFTRRHREDRLFGLHLVDRLTSGGRSRIQSEVAKVIKVIGIAYAREPVEPLKTSEVAKRRLRRGFAR